MNAVNSLTSGLFNFIENQSENRIYPLLLTVILGFSALFFATPAYHYMETALQDENWTAVMLKVTDPLDNLEDERPTSHASKKVFRITVPLIMKVLSLSPFMTYVLQWFLGFVLIYMVYKLCLRVFAKDVIAATFFTAGLVFIYFGKACFVDIYSWFDGWAYFFLIAALLFKNPLLVFLFCSAAAWTDERAFIILPVVLLFHQTENLHYKSYNNLVSFLKLNKSSIASALAIVLYLAGRLYFQELQNMHTPTEQMHIGMVFLRSDFWGFGIWSFMEGMWLVILAMFLIAVVKKQFLFVFIMLSPVLVFTVVANIVNDITRSGNYLVPLLFVAGIYLSKSVSALSLRKLLFVAASISFLFPAYYIITDVKPYFLWYKPIFIRTLEFLVQQYA